MKRFLPLIPWFALLAFPLLEVSAHAVTRARVPALRDFRAAAAFVRARLQPRDAISAAPAWTDPLLREVLGDRIDLAQAGRSDLAAYERLWSVAIRGARPDGVPAGQRPLLEQRFGRVQVALWKLAPSRVRFDFTRALPQAEVSLVKGDEETPCSWVNQRAGRGGALGAGVLAPRDRFVCGSKPGGPWTANVVMEDLDLAPRFCVYQPPLGRERLRVRFRDVPLGDYLQLYAGLYYEHERMREGGPIELRVRVDGQKLGKLVHRDGDGWKKLALPTARKSAEVSFEVVAKERRPRHFCWSGSARDGKPP